MIAIDDCDIGCAKATLEHATIPMENYIVLTEPGIEKTKDFNLKKEEVNKGKDAIKEICGQDTSMVATGDK